MDTNKTITFIEESFLKSLICNEDIQTSLLMV